jgi:hypothetical protein
MLFNEILKRRITRDPRKTMHHGSARMSMMAMFENVSVVTSFSEGGIPDKQVMKLLSVVLCFSRSCFS